MNGGRINNNESKVNGYIGIYGNGTFTRNSGEIRADWSKKINADYQKRSKRAKK